MPSGQRPRNRLLQALPEADYEALRPHLEVAVRDTALVEAGAALTQVYLPHAGAVSMVVNLSEGQAVKVAMIGRDGVVGASTALVDGISLSDLVVPIPGVTVTVDETLTWRPRAKRGRAVVNGAETVSALRASIPDASHTVLLAGGTRSRFSPKTARYADAPAGALLTGLVAGELSSRRSA